MGISISYLQFVEDGVVLSTCLRKGIHTTGALDNLEHDQPMTPPWILIARARA